MRSNFFIGNMSFFSFMFVLVSIPFIVNAWDVFHFRKPWKNLFEGKLTKISFILSVIIFIISLLI